MIYSLRHEERPRYRKYVLLDATDVSLPSYYNEHRPVSPVCLLIDSLLALLDGGTSIDHYVGNIREYIVLLRSIAELGNPERQCLLEREAVSRLVKFYENGRADRTNVCACACVCVCVCACRCGVVVLVHAARQSNCVSCAAVLLAGP